jgi:autotransporter translocation and assembly factor TamB
LLVTLQPQGGKAGIEVSADEFALPIGGDLSLVDFSATGTITATELALRKVEGRALGGRLAGNARVNWSDGWSLDGELEARQMSPARIAPQVLSGDTLQGKGVYSMRALVPDRLFMNARLDGNFTIQKGSIHNVDMMRMLQSGGSGGGTTPFTEMSGSVSADPDRLVVRQMRIVAGLMSAGGQVEMDPEKNLSGRLLVELRAATVQARTTVTVSGTLQDPQFRHGN